jgi:NADPH:quinone reductase-like Zn-dependent oxidoreductase
MTETIPSTMRAVRLRSAGGPEALALEEIDTPRPPAGEALVRVHAAALTRDELQWPVDRLPAIPSYELAGEVADTGADVTQVAVGDRVFALTPFDRDGVAADYAIVSAALLVHAPRTLEPVEAAAVPLPALTAWQGMFVHGGLEAGQRVLISGGSGGVGHLAVQLAHDRGAHVVAITSAERADDARSAGADEVIDLADLGALDPVDLVFDTTGGEPLARSPGLLRPGGTTVSVAEEPPAGVEAFTFVVEADHDQLDQLRELIDAGGLRPTIDSVFPLADARAAFERVEAPRKRGKVVLDVARG